MFKSNGGKVGRRKGSVKSRETKQKEYKEVINYLHRGYSLRDVAAKALNKALFLSKIDKKEHLTIIKQLGVSFGRCGRDSNPRPLA